MKRSAVAVLRDTGRVGGFFVPVAVRGLAATPFEVRVATDDLLTGGESNVPSEDTGAGVPCTGTTAFFAIAQ